MKEKPILFSAPMVRAILDGSKTQTRQVIKPIGAVDIVTFLEEDDTPDGNFGWCRHPCVIEKHITCPYGKIGDYLWVRETYSIVRESTDYETGGEYSAENWHKDYGDPRPYLNGILRAGIKSAIYYPADGDDVCPTEMFDHIGLDGKIRWKKSIPHRPAIHMPRWASRITLRITDIRVERLNDLSEEDAVSEGISDRCEDGCWTSAQEKFAVLWDSIHGYGEWNTDPWVWVIEFERTKP
jgi:hypothetical protein